MNIPFFKTAVVLFICCILSSVFESSANNSTSLKNNPYVGEWESIAAEKRTNGTYGTRYFKLTNNTWEVKFVLYLDSALNAPVFQFRATGKYEVQEVSNAVDGAVDALFVFDHKFVTLLTPDKGLINNFGFTTCGLVKDVEKEITETGCSFLKSKADCGQEYDLLKLENQQLFFGARPTKGDMCAADRRPESLNYPLKRKQSPSSNTATEEQKNNLKSSTQIVSFENILDLTHTLNSEFPFIPHEVTFPFESKPLATIKENYVAANEWKIHEHIGTQIDAPNHFIEGGMSLEQLAVKDLIVPAIVIDISTKSKTDVDAELTEDDILNWEKHNGRIPDKACVIMNSGWEAHLKDDKFIGLDAEGTKHFPGISLEAATFLIEQRNISGVGVDVLSFDPGYDNEYKTHQKILGAGKWALECLANLDKLPSKGATLFVGAPKVEGATGGPVRVIAFW